MKGLKHDIPFESFPDEHRLAILGHELGNVLNGLLGMAELLSACGLTAEQSRWLRAIESSGKQMEWLIRSIWFFRNTANLGIEPHRVRVDGMQLLEQVVTSHTPAARIRDNRLFLVAQPELPRFWRLDACLVSQLLDNLVGNAIKFTRSGEIIIEVAATQVDGRPGDAIRLSVIDTGRGFDAAEAERIFLAYHRCEDYAAEAAGNRGLGLYICRGIAQAMSGQINCSSPEGGGAHFEVVLPVAFCGDEPHRSAFCSSLLKPLRCQLKLGSTLQRSVANFLARLGVRCTEREVEVSDRNLVLRISEATGNGVKSAPALILAPRGHPGPAPGRRVLEAPLLESTLGALLLEIAFEWRNLVLRNESPDSIPRRR